MGNYFVKVHWQSCFEWLRLVGLVFSKVILFVIIINTEKKEMKYFSVKTKYLQIYIGNLYMLLYFFLH